MSARSLTTTIELCINGHACERDVTVHYEYSPAGGDGWNEPRYEAGATLCAVEVDYLGPGLKLNTLDLLPLITKECISDLESACVHHEAEEREYRQSEAADRKREEILS